MLCPNFDLFLPSALDYVENANEVHFVGNVFKTITNLLTMLYIGGLCFVYANKGRFQQRKSATPGQDELNMRGVPHECFSSFAYVL